MFIDYKGERAIKKVGRNKRTANQVVKTIETQLALGKLGIKDKPDPTFGKFAKEWIKNTVPITCKESTLRSYQGILKKH